MSYRKHQQEVDDLCNQIGSRVIPIPKFIGIHCICGGGKSVLPVIFAFYLIKRFRIADKIVWLVPNGTLREQAAEAFSPSAFIARILGHNLEVCECNNSPNPCKGTAGYVATPNAVLANPQLHADYFADHRCLLVIDEFHHMALDSPYERAVRVLQANAVLTVLMTGFLGRSKGEPLGFVRYNDDGTVDRTNSRDYRWIQYDISDALREQAIIRTHFCRIDGAAKWKDLEENVVEVQTLGNDRNALFTALSTEYALHLLSKCYDHWFLHSKTHPRSKLLVVCANTTQASKMLKYLRGRGEERAAIATYKEGDQADEMIRRFRKSDDVRVLVTVAKAYEGLDVKSITHLAILTHIRSVGWILQNLARGWRFDDHPLAGPWHKQFSYVFAPDDDRFSECIRLVETAQEEAAILGGDEDEPTGGGPGGGTGGGPSPADDRIIPQASTATHERCEELNGDSLSPEVTSFCKAILARTQDTTPEAEVWKHISAACDLKGIDPSMFLAEDGDGLPPIDVQLRDPTPGERIVYAGQLLDGIVKEKARGDIDRIKEINGKLRDRFGPRRALGERELIAAIRYVERTYA